MSYSAAGAESRTSAPARSASDHCEALEALEALAGLPERKPTFLTLKVAGYSYDEIAAELGLTWLTVNRQLVRARAAARARVTRQGRCRLHRSSLGARELVTANGSGVRATRI